MMHLNRAASNPAFRCCCLLLSLLVLLAGVVPVTERRVEAAPGHLNLVSLPSAWAITARAQSSAPRRAGELIVRFRENVAEHVKDAIAGGKGARRGRRLRGESGFEMVELPGGQDPLAVAAELRFDPAVEIAESNFLITRAQVTPDDPRFDEQWALQNRGQSGGLPGSDIGAARAWRNVTGSPSTVVAVIDSGVDFTHRDLRRNQWRNHSERNNTRDDDRNGFVDDLNGWDWITGSGVIRDEQGHGTAVAGIIAARGNNNEGITGVMWRASLMSLRVLDNTGTGDIADAVEAIDYAVAEGAQVINCSWGTAGESAILRDAIERAGARGVVVVASAGNGGQDLETAPYYPASYSLPNVVAVASTDAFDQLASWSNWSASDVTVAAPGVDILSTRMGGGYSNVSGTSVSAPLVAGIAGLVKSERPWLSAAGTRAAIIEGARTVAGLEGRVAASGVASARGALRALRGPHNVHPGAGNGPDNEQGGQAGRHDPPRGGGRERGGNFDRTPPETTRGSLANLPRLDRIAEAQPAAPTAPQFIQSNFNDCPTTNPRCDSGGDPPGSSDPDFSTARTEPRNETGQPGVDLGSRNYNWSVPLVHLTGRAGLDLSLALVYNSLVWTKQGGSIKFNADDGFPSPGFRLGVPKLQRQFTNTTFGGASYLLVTPVGSRIELQRAGFSNSNIYVSNDGSNTQLTDSPPYRIVRTSDGTRLTFYTVAGGEMLCTEIKDRNGNFITINYDTQQQNRVISFVDTLARVVTFNYGANGRVSSISQTWDGATHQWATFGYGSLAVADNFPGLTVYKPAGAFPVLTQLGLPDGSSYGFDYNPWGQVYRINHYAPDNHRLAYTEYNLPLTASAQSDCPRFTERTEWVEYGVMNESRSVVTTYSEDSMQVCNQPLLADGAAPCRQETLPDGTIQKEFFATAGWQKGLTTRTETWSGGELKKWTTMLWESDSTSYQKNPRPKEIKVGDASGNQRRTVITYETVYDAATYSNITLPNKVEEFGKTTGNESLLRTTTTSYRWDSTYLSRRIIGLVLERHVYEGASTLVAKTSYGYDWGGEDIFRDTPQPATRHDRQNYPPTFIFGRGNLSQVARWDVADPANQSKTQETKFRVNSTGAVLMERDRLWHEKSYEYDDSFADGAGRHTFAYPTKVIDPRGYESTTRYHYHNGSVTETRTPGAGTGAAGDPVQYATTKMEYDAAGRIEQVTQENNGAYTRWVYPPSMHYLQTFTRVETGQPEMRFEEHYDGAGRVRATSQTFPDSVEAYRGVFQLLDVMGRVVRRSNPTKIDAGWVPFGEDDRWRYTDQAYDWQGRPTLTTNTDGTTREQTYGGCGCAGGEVVTARDEHGRQTRLTRDALGRLLKTEELNLNGAGVYSTASYAYNARDQITSITHAGQVRTMEYDGHGRLSRRTTPEQGTTEYDYNEDDTLKWVRDARGVVTSYGYTDRHEVKSISHDVTGAAGVPETAGAAFVYDAAGNRTSMTDGTGTTTYGYDALARLTAETRTFNGVPGAYRLDYRYNLANHLTRLTQQYSLHVDYVRDYAGQVTAVNNVGYGDHQPYATNIRYRTSGAMEGMSYGNGRTLALSYDGRLRLSKWDVAGLLGWEYSYDALNEKTGRVSYAGSIYDRTLDRAYEYDHVGRLTYSTTGSNARALAGMGDAPGHEGPYSQSYSYDERGNLTQRQGWGGWNASSSYPFDAKNRNLLLSYDTAGNVTGDGSQLTYDATGQQVRASYAAPGGWDIAQGYDGDRQRVKKVEGGQTTVYLRSTVLGGQVVGEYNQSGTWLRGYVYDGTGSLLAMQAGGMQWVHTDPVTKSQRVTDRWGNFIAAIDVDPWGGETSRMENGGALPSKYTTYERDGNGRDQAMMRSYHGWFSRFDQPDPWDGSYDLTNPQSFNRYAYVGNDPVNFVDPSGLFALPEKPIDSVSGIWGILIHFNPRGGGRPIRPRAVKLPEAGGHLELIDPQISVPKDIRCPPTKEELAANPIVQNALNKAWADSAYGTPQKHEEGGWIYFNPFNGKISTKRASEGSGDSIDLRNPPSMRNALVVGTFHTHPQTTTATGYWDPEPSGTDVRQAFERGVPGVVLADTGLFYAYGPNRLGSDPERAKPIGQAQGFLGNSMDTRKLCP